ncbi:MAG: transposase [Candidatus Thiodiazotropha sp. (ex Dulcina madagascariensis)]|nr:transposase [Candidatus Thiodiazotropha sp. (ex Dulcina madagascariensis)]
MTHIRRYFVHHAPIFITAVCHRRQPYLKCDEHKALLLLVMREVKGEWPFRMVGYVILDEHFHWLILSQAPESFPLIMQSVKLRFARRFPRVEWHATGHVWQRRYWDHIIRNDNDLQRHLDYIHYNPVKHGLAKAVADYRWSSFGEYFQRGMYLAGWGETMPKGIEGLVPE